MNLVQKFLVNNDCYKANRRIKVKGLMLHSTGANNPYVKRYVDDNGELLGVNSYNNDWNRSGVKVCVHGFIGYDKNRNIVTVQTLPWDMRAWHAGGDANNTHIGVEICEDGLAHKDYFNAVYKEAVELFAYLCKEYNLTSNDIICHCEGYKKGIASNHGDVMHWFPLHNKSMDSFREDVQRLLDNGSTKAEVVSSYTHKQFVKDVQAATGAVVDGIVGQETFSKTVTVSATKNRTHKVVRPIQKYLYELGYKEVGTIDGIAGSKFTAAVKRFQKDNGCVADGEITAMNKTWRKLLKYGG